MPIGWKINEVIGEVVINPIMYVYDIVKTNRGANTVNEQNISELIKICLDYVPHRKEDVLDIVERNFPHLKVKIDMYRLLL